MKTRQPDGRPVPIPLPMAGQAHAHAPAPRQWKSLDELNGNPEFEQWLAREFPENASEWNDPEGRRQFLKIMGASIALAGLTACTRQPTEHIVPYVKAPEDLVPGRPLFYATAVRLGGFARGVLVESHEGRPTKIEGSPEHPASLGATDVFGQAEILSLYDPDRSQTLEYRGDVRPWSAFVQAMREALSTLAPSRGAGLRLLTETITSPTLAAEIAAVLAALPEARWHVHDPLARDQSRAGAVLAFGEPVEVRYHLDKADVILSLDADFMTGGPADLALIRAFSARRKVGQGMNRLYAVESTPSLTGAKADHRLPLKPSEIEGFARALAAALGLPAEAPKLPSRVAAWITPLAADLRKHSGTCLVMAGETQPPIVHALAHALNSALENVGQTVSYTKPIDVAPAQGAGDSLKALVEDMKAGTVSHLIVLGGNPAYTAPADLGFSAAMNKVEMRIHLGLYEDETAALCHWHVPAAHDLETWGDVRAFDGTVTIQQPLLEPLYGGRSPLELLATLSPNPQRTPLEIVREFWRARVGAPADFDKAWRRSLHDGVVPGTAEPAHPVKVRMEALGTVPPAPAVAGREIVFRADPTVLDGRYANNGWLQELPKPLTKLTWDNAALLSPKTAEALQVKTGDVVRLQYAGREVQGPVYVLPGQADDVVTVHLGYGRERAGRVGNQAGFSAYALRTSDRPWTGPGLEVTATGTTHRLALTQDHWSMQDPGGSVEHDRRIVRVLPIERYEEALAGHGDDPHAAPHVFDVHEPKPEDTLFPPHKYEGHAWGMAIDLNSCVGCNACITACQSENNIPVVGKDQVARGREMHWLRVDRYFSGEPNQSESVDTHFAPVPCMHCENAPCEVVCPVAATAHSDEGLNDMVYNRCVGTKYCSNNCPYKVRRFNFYLYQDWDTPSLKMMRNPDVTVRSRGVMEKCTYCVQRINRVRIDARADGDRQIQDGEIQTACQQACPAQAIVFGDINEKDSRVSKMKSEPRNYGLLTDLNTRPRTTYQAALRNPNPDMPDERHEGGRHG
jgi:MoCo/4Fe-4S cofactor protein with predicted Tat translocation signal